MDVVDDWGRKASAGESIAPFFSNPTDSQLLFSSPSLSPPILHRVPHLTHARFLTVSGGIPPSSSSAIESSFRLPHPNDEAAGVLSYNRLQFLPFPGKASVLVFSLPELTSINSGSWWFPPETSLVMKSGSWVWIKVKSLWPKSDSFLEF
ncbi:hypothetical protein Bca52824_025877 [Brassica carinata]|uniref:Uncharacterized protein n=1 Tax=Brassica carinata TaxID=52824 RepID=A0A8X7SKL2_BRACI|nr:hypothetical protein Bca52824_025877 [Brassica carinata]